MITESHLVPPDPCCEKCGAPVTTGLMAVFCPRKDCEFMPQEGLPPEFQQWRDEVQLSTEPK